MSISNDDLPREKKVLKIKKVRVVVHVYKNSISVCLKTFYMHPLPLFSRLPFSFTAIVPSIPHATIELSCCVASVLCFYTFFSFNAASLPIPHDTIHFSITSNLYIRSASCFLKASSCHRCRWKRTQLTLESPATFSLETLH